MSDSTLRGRCGDCEHVFIVAHLPMPLAKAAQLALAARCPKCAGTKIFVADTAEQRSA